MHEDKLIVDDKCQKESCLLNLDRTWCRVVDKEEEAVGDNQPVLGDNQQPNNSMRHPPQIKVTPRKGNLCFLDDFWFCII